MKEFLKGIELDEVLFALIPPLVAFLGNKKERLAVQAGGKVLKAGLFHELMERLIDKMGIGKSETEFGLKLKKLEDTDKEKFAVIHDFIEAAPRENVEHLMIVAVNVPSPLAKHETIKGKPPKVDNGKITDPGIPDKEIDIPSDVDGGVEFLKIVATMIKGKTLPEQVALLQKMNWLPSEGESLLLGSVKNLTQKVAPLVGLPADAPPAQVFKKILARIDEEAAGMSQRLDDELAKPKKMGFMERFVNLFIIGPKDIAEPLGMPKFGKHHKEP